MKLKQGVHLAYCTNVHRGETWAETLNYLENCTLRVKKTIAPNEPYAIGLRLSDQASKDVLSGDTLPRFKEWLKTNNCYVFTINGFPFGRFHGSRVKEQVYRPDWATAERLEYTNRLFDILAALVPEGIEGSVSTLPGSFKEFKSSEQAIIQNVLSCSAHISRLKEKTGKTLHLGLEPEPLGLFETSEETVSFFGKLLAKTSDKKQLLDNIGVNYDSCHLAVEFEEPAAAISRLQNAGLRISKIHLSSALKVKPSPDVLRSLERFHEEVYLHQVIMKKPSGELVRIKDLDLALDLAKKSPPGAGEEWRIHFHIPIHSPATSQFQNTTDHVTGILDLLKADPGLCSHLEMETYTWEVLPSELKKQDVVEQIELEYRWVLNELHQRGLR